MFSIAGIDLLEQELLDHERTLLEILLQDKTTKKNIIWATDDYAELGEPYSFKKEILPELVTGEQDSLIQPRVEKAVEHQTNRTRDKAEVFTPSWICNAQNNLVDEQLPCVTSRWTASIRRCGCSARKTRCSGTARCVSAKRSRPMRSSKKLATRR